MVFMHQMVRWLTDESDVLEFLICTISARLQGHPMLLVFVQMVSEHLLYKSALPQWPKLYASINFTQCYTFILPLH